MKEAEQLKKDIDEDLKKIWLKEPDDVARMRLGIIPSGAGAYGQYFTTLIFCDGETRALGYLCLSNIYIAINDQDFELKHIYKLSRMLLPVCAEFLGYCGLNKLWEFVRRYLELMEQMSREELKEVVNSLVLYANRTYGWFRFYLPWGFGTQYPFRTKEDVAELQRLFK